MPPLSLRKTKAKPPGTVVRSVPDPYDSIEHIVRASAAEALTRELALRQLDYVASFELREQQLHRAFSQAVIDDSVTLASHARALAAGDPLLEAVAGSLVQTYLDRAQERIDQFGRSRDH